jgi:hypothetical protein
MMGARERGALVVAVILAGCGRAVPPSSTAACPDPLVGCRLDIGQRAVTARFSEWPQALHPVVLEVDAAGAAVVKADFSMVGMDMLPNRYELVRTADGLWRASVVLPVCVSGRRDWKLALAVDGASASTTFSVPK